MAEKLKVLFVASEGIPFAKTGGLADVVGTLPDALRDLGVEVKVLMPYYGAVKQGKIPTVAVATDLEVNLPEPLNLPFDLMAPESPDYPFWFVARDEFYERSQLYGTPRGDYFDNLERFAFFSGAVLPICREMNFKPDLIHCHDWQSSLVPVYLKNHWAWAEAMAGTKTLLTIHNLAYQGLFPRSRFPRLGLDRSLFTIDGLEYYDQINLLKGGIIFSDAITTVSPRYSQEIQTLEFGYGLDGVLRRYSTKLHGILNGVDYQIWSPQTDQLLPHNFTLEDLQGKAADKAALMEAFGLNKKLAKAPILAMISRLADQKGFDLVAQALPQLMTQEVMVVILGTGEERYHRWLAAEAPKYKGKLGVLVAFDNKLAHLMEAGADMFLMPSRFEPCGLNQIYSMKYGTIPIVRETGGLADTVTPVGNPKEPGTGFIFSDYTAEAFLKAIYQAVEAYKDQKLWSRIMQNAMAQDFSWTKSAQAYLDLYRRLM
ncbi:MAG: glycogen synthase GlgA [Deltaproteobacteria bacterium]|nr:glycogen synthase GlgA [Deltaproteobacteria bacterium]